VQTVFFIIRFRGVDVPVSVPVNVPVNERQKVILQELIEEGQVTTKELSVKFKEVTLKTIKRDLSDLKKKKLIKFVGPPKTGHYELVMTKDTIST